MMIGIRCTMILSMVFIAETDLLILLPEAPLGSRGSCCGVLQWMVSDACLANVLRALTLLRIHRI